MARIARSPVSVARIRREASALVRLDHGGVPRLIGQGPTDDGWCVIAEHVEGAPLSKVLRVASPAPSRAVGWTRQIAETVAHLHAAGVLHGDLHPANILTTRDEAGRDRMVIVGFGSAVIDGVCPEGAPSGRSGHTVAPELAAGGTPSPATDVYAIGAILYRMLVDRWPFAGHTVDPFVSQTSTPAPLGRHAPALRLPPGLELLVFRCLARTPEERFRSGEELAAALAAVEFLPHRDWVRAEGSVATTPIPVALVEEPPRWPWVVFALLTVILALALWLLT